MIGTITGTAGHPVRIGGYAQDFDFPVAAVQFSCDGGCTWTTYETPDAENSVNINWSFTFTPPAAGTYELLVRAMRDDGRISPEPARVTLAIGSGNWPRPCPHTSSSNSTGTSSL